MNLNFLECIFKITSGKPHPKGFSADFRQKKLKYISLNLDLQPDRQKKITGDFEKEGNLFVMKSVKKLYTS